ncbi:Aste57867_11964 [Aphanomyces stellatus]|uniref:Aste57867_11964 protein n=1 Tax=Aphanomyces stellatus TaxID=120398 RepID=A0A485KWB7_9STRA|nr:hypothetical protein As57867_011919 [Aphanomyces stellatus]VFT88819.1 Aste57867_11964 [Aphanomyces stellatus]
MHPRRPPRSRHQRVGGLPAWVYPALGVFCVFLLYVNSSVFFSSSSSTSSLRASAGERHRIPDGVVSLRDTTHCHNALPSSTLEVFEASMETPTEDDPTKLSWQYRLKNLAVMKSATFVDDAVLVLTVVKNEGAWGRGRTVQDYLSLLATFDYPSTKLSLGILTSSLTEYSHLKQLFLRHVKFAQVTILFRDDFSTIAASTAPTRKDRRRMLARYRNYALAQSLEPWHTHVVWLDADVVQVPPTLVSKMVLAKKDILQPLVHVQGTTTDFEQSAWTGTRKTPSPDDVAFMHEAPGQGFEPGDGQVRHMNDLRGEEFPPLDSVGASMLYVKADIHRQGVLFATHHVIGSEWKHEGYDGIETEGLCYVAGMLGYECRAMPQAIVYHSAPIPL